MTATATERFTISTPLHADGELLAASALPVPKLARPALPPHAAEPRAGRRSQPVFHWG